MRCFSPEINITIIKREFLSTKGGYPSNLWQKAVISCCILGWNKTIIVSVPKVREVFLQLDGMTMISTLDLSKLPSIDHLKALTQSLAMLDAILSPEWEYRYYSFNANWDIDEQVASMRNGSGDELFAIFTPNGAIIKGFAHESLMSPFVNSSPAIWFGVIDSVPAEFVEYLSEPAFSPINTTFCFWRTHNDSIWRRGNITFPEGTNPDGSLELLALFDGKPRTYKSWAEGY